MLKNAIILFLIGSWTFIFAQEPIRYTTKQGLPTNHVYDIAEDENGFIWFATKQGLVKYDGETFKTCTIKDGLPNNDTWLIENDFQGRLWFFSKSAYQGYIINDSIYKFKTYNNQVTSPRFIYKSKKKVWFLGFDGIETLENNTIKETDYFNSSNGQSVNNKFTILSVQHGYHINNQMGILFNPEKEEFCLISDKKLVVYSKDFKLLKEISIDIPFRNKNLKVDKQGLLYNQIGFFALEKGILLLDFKTYKPTYFSFKDLVNAENTNYFRCRGLKNEIQVSIPGYLMIFDYQLKLKNTFSFSKYLSKSSYKDGKGNIWLNDLTNGISLIPNTQIETKYFLQNKKVQKINSIQGNFHAGVNNLGYFQLKKGEKNFTQEKNFTKPGIEIYQIKNEGKYLISGMYNYLLKNNKLEELRFPNIESDPLDPYILGIKDVTNFKNNSYIVTGSYVIKYDNTTKSSTALAMKSGLLVTENFDNTIYVGGSDGLFQISNDKLIKPNLKNELINVSTTTLTSSQENLFVGTDGRGVYVYNAKQIFHIKDTDGLSIQKIIKKENSLWMATQNGVKKIALNKKDLSNSKIIDAFYDADGLLQNNTNDIFVENNFLYAASDIGLAKINLNNSTYQEKPKIYFKSKKDTLNFRNTERDNIAVTFALHDFINQEYTTFEYRLLPDQPEWQTTQTKTLNFSHLAPKLYTLEVRATNQHQISQINKQFLNLIPKWWQTTLAKIGFVLISLLMLFYLFRFTKKRIQRNEEAKANQEKHIAGLELQALRSQMNPHFVHNSLNAIQYYIQRNEVELSENYLSKFSQLIRLFFEYSRRQTITIKEELELLNNYLEIEKLRFEEKLQFNISVCEKIDIEGQQIPSMLLQPIVENAVNHGLFHKKENGTIDIIFKQLNEYEFQVTVKDDGIGINKAKLIYKASSKNYQSNSSKVIHERLQLLNKSKEWTITHEIQDLSDLNVKKTGTIVTLIFNQKSEQ